MHESKPAGGTVEPLQGGTSTMPLPVSSLRGKSFFRDDGSGLKKSFTVAGVAMSGNSMNDTKVVPPARLLKSTPTSTNVHGRDPGAAETIAVVSCVLLPCEPDAVTFGGGVLKHPPVAVPSVTMCSTSVSVCTEFCGLPEV